MDYDGDAFQFETVHVVVPPKKMPRLRPTMAQGVVHAIKVERVEIKVEHSTTKSKAIPPSGPRVVPPPPRPHVHQADSDEKLDYTKLYATSLPYTVSKACMQRMVESRTGVVLSDADIYFHLQHKRSWHAQNTSAFLTVPGKAVGEQIIRLLDGFKMETPDGY